MKRQKRKLLSQNFLHSRKLVKKLILDSSIGKNDLVIEIGTGKGIITQQLIQRAKNVISIELDTNWYNYLQDKFKDIPNLKLYNADFLNFPLPNTQYKVFANIPFSIEGKIIRKLIDAKNPPEDCFLIMMKELVYRLVAPYKENQFSISHKPWFELSVEYNFSKKDFTPFSNVNVAMLRFKKREIPLLNLSQKIDYQLFIEDSFRNGIPIFRNLKDKFGEKRTLNAFTKVGIRKNAKPSFLDLNQWIKLYSELKSLF